MADLPARIQLLDTAELCMRAAQVITRQPDDAEAVQLAAGPIIRWAHAGEDQVDADARRKAVKLVLNGMGRALETVPGTRIQSAVDFVNAAEVLHAALMEAAGCVPGYEPGQAAHPGTEAGTGARPGTATAMHDVWGVDFGQVASGPPPAPLSTPGTGGFTAPPDGGTIEYHPPAGFSTAPAGRLMWLVRNMLVAAMAGDPARRDELVAAAIRYGRTAGQPPTAGEYAAALAFLFRHDARLGTPAPFLPGTGWQEAMEQPSGTQHEPDREGFPPGWREPPTGPMRNPGAYAAGTTEDGGGAP